MFYLLCLECVKVLLAQPRIQISVQVRLTKQAQIHTFPLVFFLKFDEEPTDIFSSSVTNLI